MGGYEFLASSSEDPIESLVNDLVGRLKEKTSQPDAQLTCNELLADVGPHSHVLAILLFSLLNLIPAPPGYNFIMALIIIVMGVSLVLGRDLSLPGAIGRMRLPVKVVAKLLDVLSKLAGWAAKVSTPRWRALTGRAALPVVGLFAIVLGIFMLPPVPATNMLPSIGLAMTCIGVLNHDGIGVLAGGLVGVLGAVVCGVAVWFVILLGLSIGEVIEDELEATKDGLLAPIKSGLFSNLGDCQPITCPTGQKYYPQFIPGDPNWQTGKPATFPST